MPVPTRRANSKTPLPTTSMVAAFDRAACGRDRSGNMPATTSKATVPMVANAANQSRETQFGSIACIRPPSSRVQANDRAWVFGRRGKARRGPGHVGLRRARRLAHVGLDVAAVVAVQQVADQPAIEVRGAEQ